MSIQISHKQAEKILELIGSIPFGAIDAINKYNREGIQWDFVGAHDIIGLLKFKIENAEDEDKDPVFGDCWHYSDIIACNSDHAISAQQASEIADNIERDHDAEIGINWDVIQHAIECYFKR